MKAASNEKMASFSVVRKKTPFQKRREEEEAKKKREDEEAARLYENFVESFKVDDIPGGKSFVRGETINPNERLKAGNEGPGSKEGSSSSKKLGSRYVPSFLPPGLAAIVNQGKEPEKKKEEEALKEKDRPKSRNIDHFMEELKMEQEMREKRSQDREYRNHDGRQNLMPPSRFDELPEDLDPNGRLLGSFEDSDPQTTNLYVGNLSPQVDENFLLRTFGRFGPIASVKIMWPRTEEERRRQRNCGFVAFMNRTEAQAAKDEMQGVIVYEYELRIGWGKAVALPAQALPAPPPGQMAVRSKEGGKATVAWSGPGAPPAAPVNSQTAEVVVTPNVPDIEVNPPEADHLRHVIDTMAMYVLDDGCAFEQAIMKRTRGNPIFKFLFDLGSKEHTYYVWRLYSFAQGDTLQRWRTEPFIMITGSGRWIPPALPQAVVSKSPEHEKPSSMTFAAGRGRRVDQERALTDSQRDEFEDMLRALTLERRLIREAMGFALDNADAAGEVVDVLTESLTLRETHIPTKVARLMLVSDVLHNSSAPVRNASAYRTKFESSLPDIMESFNDLYRHITGRITAEALKERVLKVLQVWSDRFLFSDAYVNGLRATFLRPGNSGVPLFHTICGDAPPAKDLRNGEDFAGEMAEGIEAGQDAALAIGEGAAARELSSLPLAELERRCRHNGLSIRGPRELMVLRLLSLEEAEKQKNQEQDDGIRGIQGYGGMGRVNSMRDDGLQTAGPGKWVLGEKWTDVDGRPTEINRNWSKEHTALRRGGFDNTSGLATTWPRYEDDEMETRFKLSHDARLEHVKGATGPLDQTLVVSQPESKIFGTKAIKTDPSLPVSKWTREDDVSDEERPEVKGLGLSYSSSESDDIFGGSGGEKEAPCLENNVGGVTDSSMGEERRHKLRGLELALMEYRESLEERGIKSEVEIERKVSLRRKKLETDYGLGDRYGSERHPSFSSKERVPSEGKDGQIERRDPSSSKKHIRSRSHSRSPSHTRDLLSGDRERERDTDRGRERDRLREHDGHGDRLRDVEFEKERETEKYIRDRDKYDRDREQDKDCARDREREREKETGRKKGTVIARS